MYNYQERERERERELVYLWVFCKWIHVVTPGPGFSIIPYFKDNLRLKVDNLTISIVTIYSNCICNYSVRLILPTIFMEL